MDISYITGLQRAILEYIFTQCVNNNSQVCSNGDIISPQVYLNEIIKSLKFTNPLNSITPGAIRVATHSLKKRGAISKVELQGGNGGWKRFHLPREVYNQLLKINLSEKIPKPNSITPEPPQKNKDELIYFIRKGKTGPIKIGRTSDIENRLKGLQTGSELKLNLIKTIPGNPKLEAYLHEKFKSIRLEGEWFSPDNNLLNLIKFV